MIALTDRILPGMCAKERGRLITSTSSGAVSLVSNLGVSNALRLARVGWFKTLAREGGREGVTVSIDRPGRIAPPRIRFLAGQRTERERRSVEEVSVESCASTPLGQYGDPSEYADAVAFLASVRAAY